MAQTIVGRFLGPAQRGEQPAPALFHSPHQGNEGQAVQVACDVVRFGKQLLP